MFLSDWRHAGRPYRQPSERLETFAADIQRARIAVHIVFLVVHLIIPL